MIDKGKEQQPAGRGDVWRTRAELRRVLVLTATVVLVTGITLTLSFGVGPVLAFAGTFVQLGLVVGVSALVLGLLGDLIGSTVRRVPVPAGQRLGRALVGTRLILHAALLVLACWLLVLVVRIRALISSQDLLGILALAVGALLPGLIMLSLLARGLRYRNGRRLLRTIAAVTSVLVAAALAGSWWVATAPLPQQRQVVIPPDDASPEMVVKALVDAWDAHDQQAERLLWDRDRGEDYQVYLHVRLVRLGPIQSRGEGSVRVQVWLYATWRYHDLEHEMGQDGVTTEWWTLHQSGPGGAWRLNDVDPV